MAGAAAEEGVTPGSQAHSHVPNAPASWSAHAAKLLIRPAPRGFPDHRTLARAAARLGRRCSPHGPRSIVGWIAYAPSPAVRAGWEGSMVTPRSPQRPPSQGPSRTPWRVRTPLYSCADTKNTRDRFRDAPPTPTRPSRCEARILNKGVRERRDRDAPRRLNTTKGRSPMRRTTSLGATRSLVAVLGLLAGLLAQSATARAASPDFDTVTWTPLGCENPDLVSHTSPSAADFVGDTTFPAAYFAHDDSYLYFRYRMDWDPAGAHGFAQYAWTALMQVPSGDPFQYQYQLSLDGSKDTIEIWHNTVAQDISFSPLFHDDAEVNLFSQRYDLANGSTVNTTPLARSFPTGDGSSFGHGTDYFIDFAFPVSVMVADGLIATAADLDQSLFFPATSTNPNNYNKGYLNCPFEPMATLSATKDVSPSSAPANMTTPVLYTIAVHNEGTGIARGIEIDDPALPGYMSNVSVSVSSDDPSVTWTVVSTNPLQVKVDRLPGGATVTVQLSADATPGCGVGDFTNTATAWGVNSMQVSGSTVLHAGTASAEGCDGVDNNCDGQIDEGGNALCDDGNPCNGAETCAGTG